MAAPDNEIIVRHNAVDRRFETEVEGRLAVAAYELRGGEMVMTHTFVPPELRGRGLAEKLARAALDHARAGQLRVVPVCSYIARFIERHAEYRSLVA